MVELVLKLKASGCKECRAWGSETSLGSGVGKGVENNSGSKMDWSQNFGISIYLCNILLNLQTLERSLGPTALSKPQTREHKHSPKTRKHSVNTNTWTLRSQEAWTQMMSKGKYANTSKHSVYGLVNTEKIVETQMRKHKTVCFLLLAY